MRCNIQSEAKGNSPHEKDSPMNTATTNITEKELEILEQLANHEMHDGRDPVESQIWFECLVDLTFSGKALSGVISSCVKKDLIGTMDLHAPKDATVWITAKGMEAYKAATLTTYTAVIIFKNKETNVRIVFFDEIESSQSVEGAKREMVAKFPTSSIGIFDDGGDIARRMEQSTEHAPIEQLIAESTTD